jgi:hypothetical protein
MLKRVGLRSDSESHRQATEKAFNRKDREENPRSSRRRSLVFFARFADFLCDLCG